MSAEWDAGDLGCGDLVLELRLRLDALPPGCILKLIARDSGARADIPAWCRLTGHVLVETRVEEGRRTRFWIRKVPRPTQPT